jgi:hypothetical protein
MKKHSVDECLCNACTGYKKIIPQETTLHAFVGGYPANIKCEVGDFEDTLEFTNVLH